jgi:transposase-like protein
MSPIGPCVLKCLDYAVEVILASVRRYAACLPSSCHLEEREADRTIAIDHSMVRRWKIMPLSISGTAFLIQLVT